MQSEAMIRKAAEAIWAIRREEEDRCDMSLDDMGGEESSVWQEAKAALEAAISTDAEPVAWVYKPDLEKGDGTFGNAKGEVCMSRDGSWINVDTPLYAVPPAPAVAVKAAVYRLQRYLHQRSLSRSYNEDIHGFHVGDENREAILTVNDIEAVITALSAQVQDVAGIVEMVENCVLFSTPGEYYGLADHAAFEAGQDNAIRTVIKLLRDNLPAAPAAKQGEAE